MAQTQTHTHVAAAAVVFTLPLDGVMTKLSIPGKICSVAKSDRNTGKSLSQFCPDCEAPIEYHAYCRDGHGPHARTDLLRGRKVTDDQGNEKVVIVDTKDEEGEDITKSSLAKGKLTLTPVTRQSLVDGTTPSGNAYHFMPTPTDTQERDAYNILYSAITDNPDLAFVCRANIGRGAETLISVESGAYGGLTLQGLAYPEMLYDLPEHEVETLSKANRKGVRTLLDDLVGEFDPDEWHDRQAEAIAEAVQDASKSSKRSKATPKKKKVKDTEPTLLSAIAAAAEKKAS